MNNLSVDISKLLDSVDGLVSCLVKIEEKRGVWKIYLEKLNSTTKRIITKQHIKCELEIMLKTAPNQPQVQTRLFETNLKFKDIKQLDLAIKKIKQLSWTELEFEYKKGLM